MGMLFTLRASNLLALIVDGGRAGYEKIGVPVSGPMNRNAYLDACYLSGTENGAQAIELYTGIWEFNIDVPTWIGVSGERVSIQVDGREVGASQSVYVPAYAFVKISREREAARGPVYISISGLQANHTLGSASFDTFSGIGSPPIGQETQLPVAEKKSLTYGSLRFLQQPKRKNHGILLEQGPWETLVSEFSATIESVSRSGVRFEKIGEPLIKMNTGSLASFPVFPNVMQLPPSNAPIVLGPDAGTTGGYPVIGVLSQDGMSALSVMLPGETVRFGFNKNVNNTRERSSRYQID